MATGSAILDLHIAGLPLPDDLMRSVREASLAIEATSGVKPTTHSAQEGDGPFYDGRRHLWLYQTPEAIKKNEDVALDPNYYDKIPKEWFRKWKDKKITKSDYTPEGCPDDIPMAMNEFIMSSWERFDQIAAYEEFWLYCEQARRWRDEAVSIDDLPENSPEWVAFTQREFNRGRVNILYIMDRYGMIKDDSQGGWRKYWASTPQALLLWLKNVGVSYITMKGRQAAITSTEMGAASVRMRTIRSYKGLLLTDDVDKTGVSIFNEKFRGTMMQMPNWWAPIPLKKYIPHNSTERIMLDTGDGKHTTEFMLLSGRDPQEANGLVPTDMYIDEGQNVAMIGKILQERAPTQLAEVNGVMRVCRASYAWGTAASSSKGAGAIEKAWKHYRDMMMAGKNTRGWVVLFFDAFCRPWMSYGRYLEEYYKYVGQDNPDTSGKEMEEKKSMFASHYPMSVEDSFMRTGGDTVVPWAFVKLHRDRIVQGRPHIRYGKFEAIYDLTKPQTQGSDEPHYIKGAKFVDLKPNDPDACVRMFKDREDGWNFNYCQFTDPIQSFTGKSRMASAIMAAAATTFEKEGNKYRVAAPVCIFNHRFPNVKENWKQVKLMGMYYANQGERACPELVEYNQGQSYIDWLDRSPFWDCSMSLVPRSSLPIGYDVGTHPIGMDMKEGAKTAMHRDMSEFNDNLAGNVWFLEYFSQLSNLQQVEKQTPSGQAKVQWGASSKEFNDDLVIAIIGAYVCMKAIYAGKFPYKAGSKDAPESKTVMVPRTRGLEIIGYDEVPIDKLFRTDEMAA